MSQSSLLTQAIVTEALLLARPTIKALFAGPAKRSDLYIVVYDPQVGPVDAGVLGYHSYGDEKKWEYEYEKYGVGKAKVSLRNSCDMSAIFASANPGDFLQEGDPLYIGGVYMTDAQLREIEEGFGVVVGTSGVQDTLDEAISRIVGSLIIGLIKLEHQTKFHRPCPNDENWVGDNARGQ